MLIGSSARSSRLRGTDFPWRILLQRFHLTRRPAMHTLLRKATLIPAAALLLGAIAAQPASAQGPDLDRVMSAQEREATGIARLNASERAALEAWLARYTATVSAAVQGMTHSGGVPVNS